VSQRPSGGTAMISVIVPVLNGGEYFLEQL
jgi:hypothetical protein